MENKPNLFVALADENYIDQAKALFSCAYFNAGWQGDYLLLSHDIPENKLKWFKNKGILIYKCKPLVKEKIYGGLSPVMLDKFYLFKEYFKKWQNVIYMDEDIIIKAPLDGLLDEKGFSAVQDYGRQLKSITFNAGFFAFNTNLINKRSFDELNRLIDKYKDISTDGDQTILNSFFCNNWSPLPLVYNLAPYTITHPIFFTDKKIKTIILHFIGNRKPWHRNDPFYAQWKDNLDKADKINLEKSVKSADIWNKNKIEKHSKYLKIKRALYTPVFYLDKLIGLAGVWMKNLSVF